MSTYGFLALDTARYMTPNPKTVTPKTTIRELEALFASHSFNGCPVVEDGRLVGFVTKLDFLKAFGFSTARMVPHYDELMATEVGRVMSTEIHTVEPDTPLTRVLQSMLERRARSFPVLDDAGRLVGIIAREDLMRALKDAAG